MNALLSKAPSGSAIPLEKIRALVCSKRREAPRVNLNHVVAIVCKLKQVYIVYLGGHAGAKAEEAILEDHHALLRSVKGSEEAARASLLYSYKHTLNGFAAILSREEATELSGRQRRSQKENALLYTFSYIHFFVSSIAVHSS